MMGELKDVKAAVKPTDTLLVVDAMTGQEAAGLVKAFHEAADLSGITCGMLYCAQLLRFAPCFCMCSALQP